MGVAKDYNLGCVCYAMGTIQAYSKRLSKKMLSKAKMNNMHNLFETNRIVVTIKENEIMSCAGK
jgi:queuine/archaeosine tRNA-ribosyltransferase